MCVQCACVSVCDNCTVGIEPGCSWRPCYPFCRRQRQHRHHRERRYDSDNVRQRRHCARNAWSTKHGCLTSPAIPTRLISVWPGWYLNRNLSIHCTGFCHPTFYRELHYRWSLQFPFILATQCGCCPRCIFQQIPLLREHMPKMGFDQPCDRGGIQTFMHIAVSFPSELPRCLALVISSKGDKQLH